MSECSLDEVRWKSGESDEKTRDSGETDLIPTSQSATAKLHSFNLCHLQVFSLINSFSFLLLTEKYPISLDLKSASNSTMASRELILITGANTGLGFEIIKAIYGSNKAYDLILSGRSMSKVKEAIKSAEAEFPLSASKLFPLQVDIEKDDSIHAAFEEVEAKFGRVDALINNAGGCFDLPFVMSLR